MRDIYIENIRMVSLIAGFKMEGIVKWRGLNRRDHCTTTGTATNTTSTTIQQYSVPHVTRLLFVPLSGSLEQYDQAVQRCDAQMKRVQERRAQVSSISLGWYSNKYTRSPGAWRSA